MKSNSMFIFVVIGVILLVVLTSCEKTPEQLKKEKLQELRKEAQKQTQIRLNNTEHLVCIEDSDCTRVRKGCCGCNSGGRSTSIHRDYISYYEDVMNQECKEIFCTQVYLCDDNIQPKCVNNKCVLENDELAKKEVIEIK